MRCSVRVLHSVCGFWVHRFVGGFFNGDPHPGNILVTKAESLLAFEEVYGTSAGMTGA